MLTLLWNSVLRQKGQELMQRLSALLRTILNLGVLILVTGCADSSMPSAVNLPNPDAVAQMTSAEAKATIESLKAAGSNNYLAMLFPGNPYSSISSFQYNIENVFVGPRNIVWRAQVSSNGLDNGSQKSLVMSLKDLQPTLNVQSNGWTRIAFYNADDRWQAEIEPNSDQNTSNIATEHVLTALTVLKEAAIASDSAEAQSRFQQVASGYRAASPKPKPPENVVSFEAQAEQAEQSEDFSTAENLFTQVLAIAPWWPEGHYNDAQFLAGMGDYPDAVDEMKKYLLLTPNGQNAIVAKNDVNTWQQPAMANALPISPSANPGTGSSTSSLAKKRMSVKVIAACPTDFLNDNQYCGQDTLDGIRNSVTQSIQNKGIVASIGDDNPDLTLTITLTSMGTKENTLGSAILSGDLTGTGEGTATFQLSDQSGKILLTGTTEGQGSDDSSIWGQMADKIANSLNPQ